MDHEDLKRCVDVLKAVAHPARLRIMEALTGGERCA